jgi:hypothetical protein
LTLGLGYEGPSNSFDWGSAVALGIIRPS